MAVDVLTDRDEALLLGAVPMTLNIVDTLEDDEMIDVVLVDVLVTEGTAPLITKRQLAAASAYAMLRWCETYMPQSPQDQAC